MSTRDPSGKLAFSTAWPAPAKLAVRSTSMGQKKATFVGRLSERPASVADLELVAVGQRRIRRVRTQLVPEGDRGDVVLQRKVAAARLPTQSLNGDLQVPLEPHRVGERSE